jgi:ribosomal protein S18 acetylase RimI-like enzyme
VTVDGSADALGRTAQIAERADAAFVTHVSWALERTAGMACRITPGLVLADSGLGCDTFNFICRARLASRDARSTAADAIAHFARAGRPFSWWVGPADRPAGLGAILEALGLERAETELAMARPLGSLPEALPGAEDLEIRRVGTKDELDAYARLSAGNWTPPDPDVLTFYARAAAALLDPASPQRLYLGYLDGEPVATAEATLSDRTVALFNIMTLPNFRGRGIGGRMTWQPLRDAREAGADLGVLQAAEAGVGLYRRLGFERFGGITEYKPSSGKALRAAVETGGPGSTRR